VVGTTDQTEFLVQRLFEVVNEGKRDATYKLALLLALIDWVTTHSDQPKVPTSELADAVLNIYFRQVSPYVSKKQEKSLKQGKQKKTLIIEVVAGLRNDHPECKRLQQIEHKDLGAYLAARGQVEQVLVAQPIPRLQRVGGEEIPFLYSCSWGPKQSLGPLKKSGLDFIELSPGVRERLVVMGPLLRPVIEAIWVADVASWSKIETEEEKLRVHLFGKERTTFPPEVRKGLRKLHSSKCFYCSVDLPDGFAVDHFVPWSRFPNDAIENLVMSCTPCNSKKSDHLASPTFLAKWLKRLEEPALTEIALKTGWESNPARARAIASSIYQSVAIGSVVWDGNKSFQVITPKDVQAIQSLFSSPS